MELITDRTESDVLLGNEKGIYSYTDLNRVENSIGMLVEQFSQLGIGEILIVKTDWAKPGNFSASEWNTETQMRRYLDNVKKIKNLFPISIRLPDSMDKLNWAGANNIEIVLQTALVRVHGIKSIYRYSGEVYAGEEF